MKFKQKKTLKTDNGAAEISLDRFGARSGIVAPVRIRTLTNFSRPREKREAILGRKTISNHIDHV